MAFQPFLKPHFSDEANQSLYLSLCCFITLVLAFKLSRGKQYSNLPPSPPKLPIIGHLHQLGPLLRRSFRDLSNKYGPLLLLQVGQIPTLLVSSADSAKQVLKTRDIDFANRVQGAAARIIFNGCKDIFASDYGENWRQKRKLCVLQLLSLEMVRSFQFIRDDEIQDLISNIRETYWRSNGSCGVNMSEMLSADSNNITCRCIIGHKFETKESSRFWNLARREIIRLGDISLGDVFPSLSWVDYVTGKVREFKRRFAELDRFSDEVIAEHKAGKKDDDEKKDFVDILLQTGHQLHFELDQDSFKAILMDMFSAGNDTTSTTMEWAMSELRSHPSIMEKVQKEIRTVVGSKSKIEESDINKMQFLKCVIKETLRLHPPLPLLIPRRTKKREEVGGYDVPPKTMVFVNAWAIQRDPQVWERPEEFVPERFEQREIDFKGQDFEYIPFGSGRRICPGMAFGLASIDYQLANLLYWFDWWLPSSACDVDMGETFGLVVKKTMPLYLQPKPYLLPMQSYVAVSVCSCDMMCENLNN
ncbi:cytochrome P450 71A1-like [Neltuma alba]|uniref:cytochrome P450 71A1-like n=1 Tax=Neltuma alba TaxID=207710 RepID=UPI0010A3D70D|nr:cytochrome P450 71A1-like [Prosopis alba]